MCVDEENETHEMLRGGMNGDKTRDPRLDTAHSAIRSGDPTLPEASPLRRDSRNLEMGKNAVERLNTRIVAGEFEATEESGVDDRELESRILDSFRHQPSLETSRVTVEVYAGEARLRGELESEAEKAAVAELVTEVPGVIAVRDETAVVRRRHDAAEHPRR